MLDPKKVSFCDWMNIAVAIEEASNSVDAQKLADSMNMGNPTVVAAIKGWAAATKWMARALGDAAMQAWQEGKADGARAADPGVAARLAGAREAAAARVFRHETIVLLRRSDIAVFWAILNATDVVAFEQGGRLVATLTREAIMERTGYRAQSVFKACSRLDALGLVRKTTPPAGANTFEVNQAFDPPDGFSKTR